MPPRGCPVVVLSGSSASQRGRCTEQSRVAFVGSHPEFAVWNPTLLGQCRRASREDVTSHPSPTTTPTAANFAMAIASYRSSLRPFRGRSRRLTGPRRNARMRG